MTKKSLKDKKSKPNSAKKGKSQKNKHPTTYDGFKHQIKVQKNVEKHVSGESQISSEKKEIKIEKKVEKIIDLSIPQYSDIQKVKYSSTLERNLKEILKPKKTEEKVEENGEKYEKYNFYIIQFENYGFNKDEILEKIQKENKLNFKNLYKLLTNENFDYDKEEIEDLKNDEITVLESIFEEKMKNNQKKEISVFSEYESLGKVIWNFIIKEDSVYPMELPLIEIEANFTDKEINKLKKSIYKFSIDYIGTAMIYSIITYLEENIYKILNEEDKSESRLNSYMKEMKNSKYTFDELNNPWRMGISEKKMKEKTEYKEHKESNKPEINQKENIIDEEILKKREQLPSYKMKNEIIRTIENNQVTIISGSTGCGKTTQVSFSQI